MRKTSLPSDAVVLVALLLALSTCATSHVMGGEPGAPISPTQVEFYLDPPHAEFDKMALLQNIQRGLVCLD